MKHEPLFGSKMHLSIDQRSGLVRVAIPPLANLSDKTFLALVQGDEQAVGACARAGLRPDPGADKAYDGRWYRPELASRTASWPETTGGGRSMPRVAPAIA